MSSSVGPAVTTMRTARQVGARARYPSRRARREQRLGGGQDRGGLRHAAHARRRPTRPRRAPGPTRVTRPCAAELRDVSLRRRVVPHARVHGGRREHRASRAERERRHEVVGAAMREAREHVGRGRDDGDEVRPLGEAHVHLARERRVPHVRRDGLAADPRERDRPDEARRGRRHHGQHLGPRLHEETRQLDGLVRRDAPRHAERDGAARATRARSHRRSQPVGLARVSCMLSLLALARRSLPLAPSLTVAPKRAHHLASTNRA